MNRRRFLVKAGGVLAAAVAAASVDAPNVITQPKYQWRMAAAKDAAPGGSLVVRSAFFAAIVHRVSHYVERNQPGEYTDY